MKNQLVLLFTAIAVIAAAIGLGGEGETSNSTWVIFFGSAAAALFFYWKNRGEGRDEGSQGHSSAGHGSAPGQGEGTTRP